MSSYLVGFSVYTLAMIGIIFIGFVVVKKCSMARNGAKSHNNFLEIETSLSIEPRKTIHVIRAGGERVLLATDADRTTFLTKLNGAEPQNVVRMEEWRGQFANEAKYSPEPTPVACAVLEATSAKEDMEQPRVFKDLMKRLQK